MRFALLIVLACVAAGPATQPSNENDALRIANERLRERMAARAAETRAASQRQAVAATQAAGISVAELNSLRAELARLRAENVQLRRELAIWQKPSEAKGAHSVGPFITINQFKAAGSDYVGKRISMKCRFIDTDELRGGRMILPNVIDWSRMRSSVGEVSPLAVPRAGSGVVDPQKAPHGASSVTDWIVVSVSDGDQDTDHVYAVRRELGKQIGALHRGDAVMLEGTVVELEGSQGFGLVLDRVAQE